MSLFLLDGSRNRTTLFLSGGIGRGVRTRFFLMADDISVLSISTGDNSRGVSSTCLNPSPRLSSFLFFFFFFSCFVPSDREML
jgi:hypothetical protein